MENFRKKSILQLSWLLLLIATVYSADDGPVSQGCYMDDSNNPIFVSSPGGYDPNLMNPSACSSACKDSDYHYAGVQDGRFCFCANNISTMATSDPSTCNSPCSDNSTTSACGGPNGLTSVYDAETGVELTGVSLTASASDVTAMQVVTFSLTLASGANVYYKMDYGDGQLVSYANATGMMQHQYPIPGFYFATVYASDSYKPQVSISSAVTLNVQQTLGNKIMIECPETVDIGKEFVCNISLIKGPAISMAISKGDNSINVTYSLPDCQYTTLGNTVPQVENADMQNDTIDNVILMAGNIVDTEGYVTALEAYVAKTGSIDFLILTPSCSSGTFCYSTGQCETTCSAPADQVSCSGSNVYHPASQSCASGTTSRPFNAANFAQRDKYTATASATGYLYVDLVAVDNVIKVYPGDVLAIQQNGASVAYRNATSSEISAGQTGKGASTISGPWQDTTVAFYARAIVSNPSRASVQYAYNDTGNFTFGVTCTDAESNQVVNSTVIICAVGIGSINITTDPLDWETNTPVNLTTTIINGSDFTIHWDYGDGQTEDFYENSSITEKNYTKLHSYTTEGAYTINAWAYNFVDNETNSLEINIQYPVTELWTVTSNSPQVYPPGGVSFTLEFPAGQLPTNGTASINWADKSANTDISLPNGTTTAVTTIPFSHSFSMGGKFNVTILISNQVSNYTLTTEVTMYERIDGLAADIYYTNAQSGTTPKPATGLNLNSVPMNSNVSFAITAVRGTIMSYLLYYANDTLVQNSTTTPVYAPVTTEGTYNFTVYAWNPVQGMSDPLNISVEVQKQTTGLEIDDFYITTNMNETKYFEINIGSLGTDSCMIVQYNDSTTELLEAYGDVSTCLQNFTEYDFVYMGPVQVSMNVSHVFAKQGIYLISVVVFNSLSISNSSLVFTVTNFPCVKPSVVLENAQTQVETAAQYTRSSGIRMQATATINCTTAIQTVRQWYVYTADSKYGLERQAIDVSSISSHNKSVFYIPPLFLDYGFYKLVYVLSITTYGMNASLPWQRSLFTYINVIPSALIPILIPGSMSRLIRGIGQHVDINPVLNSIDPDFPNDKEFNVSWICHRVLPINESLPMSGDNFDLTPTITIPDVNYTKPSSDGGGCFGTGPGVLIMNNGSWNIDTQIFYASSISYEMIVVIQKDSRQANARIVIDLINGSPPNINIRCQNSDICFPYSDGLLINPTYRLGVVSDCTEDCNPPLTYAWSMYDRDGETLIVDAQEYMIGDDTDQMAINSGFFGNTSWPSVFHLELQISGAGGDVGKSFLYLHVNRPPTGGSCTLIPETGRALLDTFKVACNGWVDPEGNNNLTYTIFVITSGTNETSGKSTMSTGAVSSLNMVLPYGNIQIQAEITDTFGAFTIVEVVNMTTTLPAKADYDAFMASNYTSNIIGGGDQEIICQTLTAISSIENSGLLAPPPPDPTDNTTDSSAVADQQQITSADRIVNYLDAISSLTASSLDEMEMISSTMSNVVGSGDNVDARAKQNTADLLAHLSDVLENNVTLRSPDEIQDFATSAISTMGALVNSIANTVIDKTILPSDLANIDDMEYDTDIGDDLDFEMPQTLDGMQRGAIVDDTSYNAVDQVKAASTLFSRIGNKVLSELIPDEAPIRVQANGLSAVIAKMRGRNVSKETFDLDDASFTFPTYCQLMNDNANCNENNSMGIQAMNWPTIVQTFGKNVNQLAPNTKTLEIDVFDQNNEKMTIKNLSQPMDLYIPRSNVNGTLVFNEPDPVNVSIKWNEFMMYHQFNISYPGSSVNIEITPVDLLAPILVFIRFQKKPTIFTYDNLYRLSDIRLKNGTSDTYDLFISSLLVGSETGIFYLGIAEINGTQSSSAYAVPNNFTYDMFLQNFTTTYSLRIYTSGCYFYNEVTNAWNDNGCWVSDSNFWLTHCQCSHLTTFGSGFFIMPNTVDFSYVFAHASFNDNLTIYLTLIITFVIFILMAIWARWRDRKDVEKLGASPMPDNLKEDKYIYEILVYTGNKPNSPTDSTVYFILSGDDDETEVRRFGDDKRKIFRKGEMNVFIMTVPRPLGSLNYMRLWHDNSGYGPYASWYLNYIVIRDVQNGDKFEFIANCWFALEEGDGSIDRLLPVAGKEQMTEFSHLFSNTSQKNIADGHLWFSVFLRPPRCRFTRLQRVGCCVAFLYLSMLVNAMWYGTVNTSANSSAFKIGPFSLSIEQMAVGIMSNLIVFPISFIIVHLFRKARPRKLRPSRIEEALKRQKLKDEKEALDQASLAGLNGSQQPLLKSDDLQNQTNKVNGVKKATIRKKKFTLPWIFKIVAWLLVFACIGVSVFFLWAYGITFGNDKTKKWITSMVISFFSSILITEPVQLFLMAILFSAICKKSDGDDDDDADEDEEDPTLMPDEEYLYKTMPFEKRTRYHPPNPEALEKARALRLKEIKMWAIIREILGYLIFLWVLVVVSYGNRDPNAYLLKQTLSNEFILSTEDGELTTAFLDMATTADFWNWTRIVLVRALKAQNLYNDKPPFGYKGFLNDQVNRLMGHAIMRQIRIKRGMCDVPEEVKNLTGKCSGAFTDIFAEDQESYTVKWNETIEDLDANPAMNNVEAAFRYSTAESLDGYPFVGYLDVYGGGGYVLPLTGKTSDLRRQFGELENLKWIDKYSRAVLVEFSVYNTQVNLFGVCTIQLEFVPGGGYFQNYRFDGIRLLEYDTGFGLLVLICEVAFALFVLYFTFRELMEVCKDRKKWCTSYWNYMEVIIILISYAVITAYGFRKYYTYVALDKFNETNGNVYVNLQYVYMLDQLFTGFLAFVVFLATLKFIKLLRFNKRMGILSSTLSNAWNELAIFGIFFLIVFFSFAQLFYLLMSANSVNFSSFIKTIEYTISMMLSQFDYDEINMGCPVLGPLAFFVFSLITSIVLINLFLTIVISSFETVAHDIFKQPNEYEIVDFILKRFMGFMGIGGGPGSRPSPKAQIVPPNAYVQDEVENKNVKGFPQKVDRLLNYINAVYFDGKIDLRDEQKVKTMYGKKRSVLTDSN